MSNYLIGDYIRDTRLRRGYTQEQLSFGICTTASLSRIETGAQAPGKHILDALMERLGIGDKIFDVLVSKEDMVIFEKIQDVTRSIAAGEEGTQQLKENIQGLEQLMEKKHQNNLYMQYLTFAKGILKKRNGGSFDEIMEMFMSAIHMTLPNFDGVTPNGNNLLTFHEIAIIDNIAILYAKQKMMKEALGLGYWLKEYMEKTFIDGKEKAARYPMILYNLCNWLGNLERYEESEQVAETGVNFCIEYGNLVAFPRLLFNKGCALASLGKREEAVKIFQQTAAIFLATRQERMARMTVELCKEHYDIDVELYL